MRLFFALELPTDVKTRLAERVWSHPRWWIGDAKTHLRRVPDENLHVTLKFLGHGQAEKVAAVKSAMAAVPRVGALQLRSECVGFFPPRGGPRVFVVHLAADVERLNVLVSGIEAAMEPLGFEREKRSFKPHVTMARSRARFGAPATIKPPILEDPVLEGESFEVNEVTLFRSDLNREGSIYTTIERFAL